VKKVNSKKFEHRAFISLGSNIGNRINFLRAAVREIQNNSKIDLKSISSVYETKPYGNKKQSNFLNAVIEVYTSYNLIGLFNQLKSIENEIGRSKTIKWGPREIDLDLLFYDDRIFSDKKVTIPHKDIQHRDFVLIPFCDITGDFIHPELKQKISDICKLNMSKQIIRKTRYRLY
jgi:2-amino-4-hydroxy-6-hydroxymethyldihydropteridine diphosphokinase